MDLFPSCLQRILVFKLKKFTAYCGRLATVSAFIISFDASIAQTNLVSPMCIPRDYVLGFFNGVGNTKDEALKATTALELVLGSTVYGSKIEYQSYYNTSGRNSDRSNTTIYEDATEVFAQRSSELDGIFLNRWEYFWEAFDDGRKPISARLIQAIPDASLILESLSTAFRAKKVAALIGLISSPPTLEDYARQKTQVDRAIKNKKRIIFFGHSQGSLFLNVAYSYATNLISPELIKAVYVAPASIRLFGPYTLADIDLVISALRSYAPGKTAESNIDLKRSGIDPSGHELISTYLDANRPAREQIKSQVLSSMRLTDEFVQMRLADFAMLPPSKIPASSLIVCPVF